MCHKVTCSGQLTGSSTFSKNGRVRDVLRQLFEATDAMCMAARST
jgi:hypothetical protein